MNRPCPSDPVVTNEPSGLITGEVGRCVAAVIAPNRSSVWPVTASAAMIRSVPAPASRRSNASRIPSCEMLGWLSSASVFTVAGSASRIPVLASISPMSVSVRPGATTCATA